LECAPAKRKGGTRVGGKRKKNTNRGGDPFKREPYAKKKTMRGGGGGREKKAFRKKRRVSTTEENPLRSAEDLREGRSAIRGPGIEEAVLSARFWRRAKNKGSPKEKSKIRRESFSSLQGKEAHPAVLEKGKVGGKKRDL